MILTQTLRKSVSLVLPDHPSDCIELSRLLAAAVVNHQFRQLLLNDPEQALKNGYQGETFHLADGERALLLSLRADSLTDLASQLTKTLIKQPYTYPANATRYYEEGY